MVGDESRTGEIASFGPFRLTATERLLTKGDEPVLVGGRALDILIALVERAGQIVSRRELLDRVWPNVIVEEANLRVHVASLRKVLGDGQGKNRYIANVPGRGYCFVAPVRRLPATWPAPTAGSLGTGVDHRRLPAPLARMVGREETVAALCSLLKSRRFVSVVGAGGIGKTTVALGVGHALLGDYDDGACFVDLGALTDADHIPGSVATTLGCLVQTQDPVSSLLAFLADKRILLMLDSCEHLIDAVAKLAERLFSEAPMLHILATSREALRAEGENVYLLGPLGSPDEDGAQTAGQALASPAVQLFIDRAAASGHRFELTDADAPIVARICRQLDGIPLAIELAASRAGVYGVQGIAGLLENRFKLLWQGRRSALQRHQTLQAMLDWSYNLLSAQEQMVLSRLSAFVGNFTIDAALAVAGDIGAETSGVADTVASLVDKSLVWISDQAGTRYLRLPDTTRAYASAKLAKHGREEEVARRHALYCIGQFRSGTIPAATFGGHDASAYAPYIGNVRAALDWCFSTSGDIVLGIELAAQSAPLFFGLSLLSEGERWCKHALTVLPETELGTERELALQEALAISSMYKRGNSDEVKIAIERAFSIAEELGDRWRQLHLLAGLNIFLARAGDHRATLAAAERGVAIAGELRDPAGMIMAEFALGVAHHLAGHQAAAQCHCERGLVLSAEWNCRRINFFGFDHRVRALTALARVLWLRGLPVRAVKTARQAVDEAMSRGHPVDLASALAHSTPVFVWAGDFEAAADLVDRTIAHTTKHALRHYLSVGLALRGELTAARGELAVGLDLMREALTAFQAQQHNVHATILHGALAEGLARCGEFTEATIRIAGAVEAAERGGLPFNLPDLLRAQAEILLAAPRPDPGAAEAVLLRSLEWARKQSALGWELRAAIPLARLWARQGRVGDARDLLASVYEQFTEGFETADLKAAGALLGELRHGETGPMGAPTGPRTRD